MRKGVWWFMLCFSSSLCASDLDKDLKTYLGKFNTYSHVEKSEIYFSQRAGYMTGGGVSIRNGVTDTKLANVTLPKFDAGCGGIDIFTGGISFIGHDQFVAALKNIASAAQGYAFMLGIETVSPTIASTMKQMETWANAINSLGINSCDTATGLVGAVWPQRTAAKQQICRSAKSGGFASSYINARHQCSEEGDYASTMKNMASNPLYDDLLLEEYNLAWRAIQKQPFLAKKENKAIAEEIMSVTGTVIIRKDQTTVVETWPSRVYDESFVQILLEGGKTQFYHCKEGKNCLSVETRETDLAVETSWKGMIKQALASIQQKILIDTELSVEEIDLLSKSRLPLYKIVNVLTAYKREASPVSLYEVAEIVGAEMLIQYLREIIGNIRLALLQLERGQMYDFDIKNFIDELERVERIVSRYEERNYRRLEAENQLMLKIDTLEQKIASQVILF